MTGVSILGSGAYIPSKVVTNEELEEKLGLPKGYISKRTGVVERRWSNERETNDFMASVASLSAVVNAKVDHIDEIVIARDAILTENAYSLCLPIKKLLTKTGIDVHSTLSYDLTNGCTAFAGAVNIAQMLVRCKQSENVLVVASTNLNNLINFSPQFNQEFKKQFDSRSSQVRKYSLSYPEGQFQPPSKNAFLWGGGAGAIVVGKTEKDNVIGATARASSLDYDAFGIGEAIDGKGFISLDGPNIFKYAVDPNELPRHISDTLQKFNLSISDIGAFVPHQPQPRMLKGLAQIIGLPEEKLMISCDYLGNVIAASVPITYHLSKMNGKIKSGDLVYLCSFGDSYLSARSLLFRER